jgi:hypothetical protein
MYSLGLQSLCCLCLCPLHSLATIDLGTTRQRPRRSFYSGLNVKFGKWNSTCLPTSIIIWPAQHLG